MPVTTRILFAFDVRPWAALEGRKARLADTLIAQSGLDHQVPLITLDADFRNFARATGLRLFPRLH